MDRVIGIFGLAALIGIAWLLSNNRKAIDWRLVGIGVALQAAFAAILLVFPPGQAFFEALRIAVTKFLAYSFAGSEFLFGPLAREDGPVGAVFAFRALPTIIFFGAFMMVMYHLGVVQRVVVWMARFMTKTMRVSGAESLSVAANVFIGQTEAPLVVRPYIKTMTMSELMVLMTGGMATIAGGVLAAYVAFGIDAGHLVAASVMSAPAALVTAKIIIPETQPSQTAGVVELDYKRESANIIDAAAVGATQGMKLAFNVGAMLIAFIALVALIDGGLGKIAEWIGTSWWPASLNQIFGYMFYPLARLMGVPGSDAFTVAGLMGTKISINEFLAFAELGDLTRDGEISERGRIIATYALCGFANFSSIGIQIGGISSIEPSRRSDLARLGLKALAGGALASWMTATIVGIMI